MDRCSNSCENSQRRERVREEIVSRKKIRDGKSEKRGRRKKIKVREKVKVAKQYVFFQCFVAPEGRGAGSLKRPSGPARYQKLHAAVVRSTFRSQNVKRTLLSEHFWKLRC